MSKMFHILLLTLLVATIQGTLVLTPTPDNVLPGLTPRLDLRCALTADTSDINRIMVIQIEKINGNDLRPLASVTTGENAKVVYQFQGGQQASVAGTISTTNPTDSFLQLTILNPDDEDAGMYDCAMSILDKHLLLEKSVAKANVTLIGSGSNGQVDRIVFEELQKLKNQMGNLAQEMQIALSGTTASNQSPLVAFTARPAARRPFKIGALQFEDVEVNEGGAYDPGTSSFVAPVNGTYVMSATISCQEAKTITELKVNNETKAQLPTVGDDQASVTLAMNLLPGDRVWLEGIYDSHNGAGTIIFADKDTVFSGFLLD